MEVVFHENKQRFQEMKIHNFTQLSLDIQWINNLNDTTKLKQRSRLKIMIKGIPINKHRHFIHVRNNYVESENLHSRVLCQLVDPKFFDPSQSAVSITSPLANENVNIANTLIDEDLDSPVDEKNTEFDSFSSSIE